MNTIKIQDITIGDNEPFLLVAGPCVIEDEGTTMAVARRLKEISLKQKVPLIFKASYDKANRTSLKSFRGPGIKLGMEILSRVKREYGLPILTDIHSTLDIPQVVDIADVIQIPAFLCRQTDILIEAAKSGRAVNIKKGQFIAPWDVRYILEKALSTGNRNIIITERGTAFGYNNLVVDFRGIPLIRSFGCPVVFDATHSVQLPGGRGDSSGGDREMAAYLASAAVAIGIDGLFLEVHPDPDKALSDGPNSLPMDTLPALLERLKRIDKLVKNEG